MDSKAVDADPNAHPLIGTALQTVSGALFIVTIGRLAVLIIEYCNMPPGFLGGIPFVWVARLIAPHCLMELTVSWCLAFAGWGMRGKARSLLATETLFVLATLIVIFSP